MGRARTATIFVVALFSLLLAGTPAAAAPGRLEVQVDGGGPVFDLEDLYPGATEHSTVRVSNVGVQAGRLTVDALDVVDESRCSDAELRAGMPCGDGTGTLGGQLEFSIARIAGQDLEEVWKGPLSQLDEVELLESLGPGETATYRFSAHLPVWSGNESQADQLGFDLQFRLSDDRASVAGASIERREAELLGVRLPMTRPQLIRWSYGGASGLLAASVVLLASDALRRGVLQPRR